MWLTIVKENTQPKKTLSLQGNLKHTSEEPLERRTLSHLEVPICSDSVPTNSGADSLRWALGCSECNYIQTIIGPIPQRGVLLGGDVPHCLFKACLQKAEHNYTITKLYGKRDMRAWSLSADRRNTLSFVFLWYHICLVHCFFWEVEVLLYYIIFCYMFMFFLLG